MTHHNDTQPAGTGGFEHLPAQLRAEVLELLARMLKISELPARPLQSSPGGGKPGSAAPRGPDASMFDEWTARFNQAGQDEPRVRRLLAFARAALYNTTREGVPAIARLRGAEHADDDQASSAATVEDIIALGAGMDPVELAAIVSEDGKGYAAPSYIRRVRQRNGLDPNTGLPRPAPRTRVEHAIRLLAEPGATQQTVAQQMGVAQSTVSRWLAEARHHNQEADAA